jgi:hypothetical protein
MKKLIKVTAAVVQSYGFTPPMMLQSLFSHPSKLPQNRNKLKATPHNSRRTTCLNIIPSACPENLGKASALP